jgi:hypothetical protein
MPREMLGGDGDDSVLVSAKKLADKLRAKKAYTNTSTFDLRCQVSVKASPGCAFVDSRMNRYVKRD